MGQVDSGNLVSLPLPFLTFLLCAALAVVVWRLDTGVRASRVFFTLLFGLFALEAFLVGLRFGYGIDLFVGVQRVLPLLVGPVMYLGFLALAEGPERFRRLALWHLGVAAGLVLLTLWRPVAVDWVIGALFAFYIGALVLLWRKGSDHLVHARLGLSRGLSNWMLRGAGLMAFVLVMDVAIAADFALSGGRHVRTLISWGSVPLILLFGAVLFALPRLVVERPQVEAMPAEAPDDGVLRAARELLEESELYLDPDLTVQRLARRLHVPEKTLSAAINQGEGMNVSQYVNGFRVRHAATLLRETDASVAEIVTRSGFLTRSNFYREFQRVYGQTPAAWRKGG